MESEKDIVLIYSQRHKLWIWGGLLIFSGVSPFFSEYIFYFLRIDPIVVDLGAVFIFLFSLLGAVFSIKCPKCRLGLVWYAMSKKDVGAWLEWLLNIKKCPRCKIEGSQL